MNEEEIKPVEMKEVENKGRKKSSIKFERMVAKTSDKNNMHIIIGEYKCRKRGIGNKNYCTSFVIHFHSML